MIILKGKTCPKAGGCKFPCIARQPIEISEFYCGIHDSLPVVEETEKVAVLPAWQKNGKKLPMMDNSYNLTAIWHEQSTVY